MTSVLSSRLPSPSWMFFSFSRKYGSRLTWYLLICANCAMRSSCSPWCDAGWNGSVDAALRIDARRAVAADLEREDARDVGGERQRLQVEHQLDVLVERVGHAGRRAGQLARLAARVARLDALDAPLDLADVVEVLIEPRAVGRRRASLRSRAISAVIQSRMLRSVRRSRGALAPACAPTPNS